MRRRFRSQRLSGWKPTRRADENRPTIAALQLALELAGVEFIDENGGGPGVRLRDRLPNKPK